VCAARAVPDLARPERTDETPGRKVASGSEDGEGADDDGGRGGGGQVPPPPHRHAPRQRLRHHAQGPLPVPPLPSFLPHSLSRSLESWRSPRCRSRPKGRWFGVRAQSDGERVGGGGCEAVLDLGVFRDWCGNPCVACSGAAGSALG
jgi:hypothetical protein